MNAPGQIGTDSTLSRRTALARGACLGGAIAGLALGKWPEFVAAAPVGVVDGEQIISRAHTVTGGGGIQLRVDEAGYPNGQPIVFIHGFSGSRLAWRRELESDLAADFRLLAVDMRGHGLSDKPDDAYDDPRLWADDIQGVIEQLGLDRPIVVGHSNAGAIICDYLSVYGQQGLGGIVLVGARTRLGSADGGADSGPKVAEVFPRMLSQDAEENMQGTEGLLRLLTFRELPPAEYYGTLGFLAIVPPYVRRGASRAVDYTNLLPRLRLPVLIAQGDQDAVFPLSAAQRHAELIHGARLSVYPDVGHMPMVEYAERFNCELRQFAQAAT